MPISPLMEQTPLSETFIERVTSYYKARHFNKIYVDNKENHETLCNVFDPKFTRIHGVSHFDETTVYLVSIKEVEKPVDCTMVLIAITGDVVNTHKVEIVPSRPELKIHELQAYLLAHEKELTTLLHMHGFSIVTKVCGINNFYFHIQENERVDIDQSMLDPIGISIQNPQFILHALAKGQGDENYYIVSCIHPENQEQLVYLILAIKERFHAKLIARNKKPVELTSNTLKVMLARRHWAVEVFVNHCRTLNKQLSILEDDKPDGVDTKTEPYENDPRKDDAAAMNMVDAILKTREQFNPPPLIPNEEKTMYSNNNFLNFTYHMPPLSTMDTTCYHHGISLDIVHAYLNTNHFLLLGTANVSGCSCYLVRLPNNPENVLTFVVTDGIGILGKTLPPILKGRMFHNAHDLNLGLALNWEHISSVIQRVVDKKYSVHPRGRGVSPNRIIDVTEDYDVPNTVMFQLSNGGVLTITVSDNIKDLSIEFSYTRIGFSANIEAESNKIHYGTEAIKISTKAGDYDNIIDKLIETVETEIMCYSGITKSKYF